MSKAKLTFSEPGEVLDEAKLAKSAKLGGKPPKSLTIWLESHGAPGWLFAGPRDATAEFRATLDFAQFVRQVEALTGARVDNVVLSGCFTANEMLNEAESVYSLSPARMLSYLLPGTNVVGFIGQNANAKVTHLYERDAKGFKTAIVNPEEAAVLYRDGAVVESYAKELYCDHSYTPSFINRHCKLGLTAETKPTTLYRPVNALEVIASRPHEFYFERKSYGETQKRLIETERARLLPAVEDMELGEGPAEGPVV